MPEKRRTSRRVVRPTVDTERAKRARQHIRAYLGEQPLHARRLLRQLRTIVRREVPAAVDDFSYAMPGFRLAGKGFIWYAGWTHHYSLYPISESTERALAEQLARHTALSGRGTVRLPLDASVPEALIAALVKARARELAASGSRGGDSTSTRKVRQPRV